MRTSQSAEHDGVVRTSVAAGLRERGHIFVSGNSKSGTIMMVRAIDRHRTVFTETIKRRLS